MNLRSEIMASLGAPDRIASPWVHLNGWVADFRPRDTNQGGRKWHYFARRDGNQIVSACGRVQLPYGTELSTQGHLSQGACRQCWVEWRDRSQPDAQKGHQVPHDQYR